MITTYAWGRNPLPKPIVTTITNNSSNLTLFGDFYFWIKAKNLVGFTEESLSTKITIPSNFNSSNQPIYNTDIVISSVNFQQFVYENWLEFYLIYSDTDDIQTGRIIYKRKNYDDNGNLLPISNFILDKNQLFTTPKNVPNTISLPTNVLEGFRIRIDSFSNSVYEFTQDNLTPNNITILNGTNGFWRLLDSNSLIEDYVDIDLAVEMVSENEIQPIILNTINDRKSIKYYVINNSLPFVEGNVILNETFTNSSLVATFDVKIIGYLNLDNFSLDTSGINNINVFIEYPTNNIILNKPLPFNHALVLEIVPNINNVRNNIIFNSSIYLNPKIENYVKITPALHWAEPVADLDVLQYLLPIQITDYQIRFVKSKQVYYYYVSNSSLTVDGDNVIQPINVSGRWLKSTIDVRDNSITFQKLDNDLKSYFSNITKIEYITYNTLGLNILELSNYDADYFVIKTPIEDGTFTPFTFDFNYNNLDVSKSKEFVVEFKYRDSTFRFDNFIKFSNNNIPLPSGNNKTDIFIFQYQVSDNNIITKRGFVYAQNV